jgi:hypothetical protein
MAGRHPADEKTPGTIEAEVLMERTVHAGSFLLIEGDDDVRFYGPRIDSERCHWVDCRGKRNAQAAIARLDQRRFRGALAVVDDDFDTLLGTPPSSENLLRSDAADLECLLLRSPALERALAELADPNAVRRLNEGEGGVRAALLSRGMPFGKLRWLALRCGWSLPFEQLKAANFIDAKSWQVKLDALYAEGVRLGMPLSAEAIQAELDALPAADPWWSCRGHDLIDILLVGLKGGLGRGGRSHPSRESVSGLLRQSLHADEFAATCLHAGIVGWQNRNPPYQVLRRAETR